MHHFFFPYANRGASLVHAHIHRKGGKNNWTWCEGQDVLDFEAFFSRVIKIVVFGNLYLFPAFLIFNMWFKFSHSSVESIGILQVYWTFKIFFQYKAMQSSAFLAAGRLVSDELFYTCNQEHIY